MSKLTRTDLPSRSELLMEIGDNLDGVYGWLDKHGISPEEFGRFVASGEFEALHHDASDPDESEYFRPEYVASYLTELAGWLGGAVDAITFPNSDSDDAHD